VIEKTNRKTRNSGRKLNSLKNLVVFGVDTLYRAFFTSQTTV